jgi:peroxiredoxin/tetratricopeptide (TPR) repeat protein
MQRAFLLLCGILSSHSLLLAASGDDLPAEAPKDYGHSSHGSAYDEGPRQRPWRIEGIGHTPFPITTQVPEVQEWFDQGNALLHSFWYYEAERAFRWCIKLDPECAMAYWGLARSVQEDRERFDAFLQEAIQRKDQVSDRERRYIEAFEEAFVANLDRIDPPRLGWNATSPILAKELEKIILEDPEDLEAKALYVLNSMFRSGKYAMEAVLQQVLEIRPDHPGALHYRIHNWDSMELGHHALDSCEQYGKVAPNIGHANHMPGHIYTKLGMWHEGAIWLDRATRVEKDYMHKRLIFPFNAWNYAHNRNFLASAQSMLGMPSMALQGARDLLNAPRDPEYNKDDRGYSVFREGISALRRTLVRFERWQEILEPGRIPWRDIKPDKIWQTYCEALAHLGLGQLQEAEEQVLALRRFEKDLAKGKEGADEDARHQWQTLEGVYPLMWREAEGRLRLQKDDLLAGLSLLIEAAERECEHRKHDNDPPSYPRCLYNVLGEAYLDHGNPQLAVAAFEKALEAMPNNGFSHAGLARAWHALGDLEEAQLAYGQMLHVWSHSEPGIWQEARAHDLGLTAEPRDPSPEEQRCYAAETLATVGPNTWQPYVAPAIEALSASRETVRLQQYRGKNVLLIFYLSEQCVHCVEQLRKIQEVEESFAERDTVVLAISADPPERNAAGDLADLPFILLSDSADHSNAIRFRSYDEFEEIELHSTNFIDRKGRLRWARTGGDPFMDMDFLLNEIDRVEKIEEQGRLAPVGAVGGQ